MGWIVALVLGAGWLLGAAQPSTIRIGVVDADQVRLQSTTLQRDLKAASAPAEAIQEQLKARQAELQAAVAQYQAQQSVASQQVNDQRLAEIQRLNADSQALAKQMEAAIVEAEQTRLEPMRRRVLDAIAAVARDRGLDMVLSVDRVLYHRPELDLTAVVVARLDASGVILREPD
jgi:outer membrane protein